MKEFAWIVERDVLFLHDRLLVLHGGSPGIRDRTLLQSALARPQQHAAYGTPDLPTLAAVLTAGIVRNHPFIDGNKRTGFVCGVLFLEVNGSRFSAPEEEAAQAVIALAAGQLDEAGYSAFLKAHCRT